MPGLHGSLVRNSLRDANLAFAGACSLMLGRASISQIFRLIDVRQKKIVEFASVDLSTLEYAALSYVWGGPQWVTLLKQNLVHLQQDGALGELPGTLADAIVFTAALDLRYLWIDAICIIQDSNEDQAFQIGNMASIYSCSTITIIAASGKDADYGLAGVQRPRTGRQNELRVPVADGDAPISLVTTLCRLADDDSHFLSTAIWSTRGWTFQERELARRVVVFTGQQIYWACEKSYGIEETDLESEMARCIWDQMSEPHSLISDFADGDYAFRKRTWAFSQFVANYQERNLTNQGDASDAISAVLQSIQAHTGERFLWGLPCSIFDAAIWWDGSLEDGPISRRTELTTLKVTSLQEHVPFPSWSWLGWKRAKWTGPLM